MTNLTSRLLRCRHTLALAVTLCCLGACRNPPVVEENVVPPAVETTASAFVGTPLTGSDSESPIPAFSVATSRGVRVRVASVSSAGPEFGAAMSLLTRWVVGDGSANPVLPTSSLTKGALAKFSNEDAGVAPDGAEFASDLLAVAPGTTSALFFSEDQASLGFEVSLDEKSHVHLTFVVTSSGETEQVLLEPFPPEAKHFVAALPSPFTSGSRTIAVSVSMVAKDAGEAEVQALTQAGERFSKLIQDGRTKKSSVADGVLQGAVEGLALDSSRRSVLLRLAEQHQSRVAREFALVATDAWVGQLATRLRESKPGPETGAVGWWLEASALAELLKESEEPLPEELSSILLDATGELARYPDVLRRMVATSKDAATFRKRVVSENRTALEDRSASARVRAFDWLKSQGVAPQGFDPLAEAKERREALEAADAPKGDS